jgi:VanZ family protein
MLLVRASYGALDELSQLIPIVHRSCDLLDWIADMTGAAVGLAVFASLAQFARRRLGLRLHRNAGASAGGREFSAS